MIDLVKGSAELLKNLLGAVIIIHVGFAVWVNSAFGKDAALAYISLPFIVLLFWVLSNWHIRRMKVKAEAQRDERVRFEESDAVDVMVVK